MQTLCAARAGEEPLPDHIDRNVDTQPGEMAPNPNGKGRGGPSVLTITNVGTFQVPTLPPGGSATFSWSTCKVAVYLAVVDRTQAVVESDESNNTASLRNTCK